MEVGILMIHELIDPHTKKITTCRSKRFMAKNFRNKNENGEPYICFIDTCNKHMYDFQKKKGLTIKQSNLVF